jgi:hypothetical protein
MFSIRGSFPMHRSSKRSEDFQRRVESLKRDPDLVAKTLQITFICDNRRLNHGGGRNVVLRVQVLS